MNRCCKKCLNNQDPKTKNKVYSAAGFTDLRHGYHNKEKPKKITIKVHKDGRRDVNIQVNRLDIDETDKESLDAKKIIEEKVLPKLADEPVLVVVLHKPTNRHTEKVVRLKHVRAYAQAAVKIYQDKNGLDNDPNSEDFAVIEHHLNSKRIKVIVSTL